MSIIAGIYKRTKEQEVDDELIFEFKSLISRKKVDELIEFRNNRAFFVKLETAAFGEKGIYEDSNGDFAILAGEPLLEIKDKFNRQDELIEIHNQLGKENHQALPTARGQFSVASLKDNKLILVADKLGIRPLYYWIDENYVIFASCLRILEDFRLIPKKINLQGVAEIAALGYPLADRTAYENIFVIKSAEIIEVGEREITKAYYWNWCKIETSTDSEEKLLKKLYRDFMDAVTRRLKNDRTTVAYLSGGLDSRCVAAALNELKAGIHTFNFARPNTQDQIFGRQFAGEIKTHHTEIPKDAGDHIPDYSTKMADALQESDVCQEFPPEHPNLVWSGEGGSVGLGHVHCGRKIYELISAGKISEAIEEYIQREHIFVTQKFLKSKLCSEVAELISSGIHTEIENLDSADPARKFFLYLMLNDQRRKLAGHFENIDLHRLEFQLPFFDSEFLKTIISIPVKLCLEHQLYVKWLYLFTDAVTKVPWQAYPGHEPCPLPVTDQLAYQWDQNYQTNEQKSLEKVLRNQTRDLLASKNFPDKILSKTNLKIAFLIHRTGLRDYGYIFETAGIYHKYWQKCRT